MLKLTIQVEARTQIDMEDALLEIDRRISGGNLSGGSIGSDVSFDFTLSGEDEGDEEEE